MDRHMESRAGDKKELLRSDNDRNDNNKNNNLSNNNSNNNNNNNNNNIFAAIPDMRGVGDIPGIPSPNISR